MDLVLIRRGSPKVDAKILSYVPKAKREAVEECWRDSDGIWIILKDGWNADRMDQNCQTIHEDTVADLKWQIAGISKRG